MRDFLPKEKELYRRIDDFNKRANEENKHAIAVDECLSYAKLVTDQKEVFDQCRHDAQKMKDTLGQLVVYPETPQIVCPSMENWQSWTVEEAAAITQKAKTFLPAFNQKIDEFNKLIDDYNKHQNATDTCQEFANLVTQQKPYLDAIRQDALIINNQLGKLILFPETPQITCPSMEHWSEWSVAQAEAQCEVARIFLETINQKIAELNELIVEYNKRMQQETVVEVL